MIACMRCEQSIPPGHRYVTSQVFGGTFDLPCYDIEADAAREAQRTHTFMDPITVDRIPDIAPEQYVAPPSSEDQTHG